MIVVPRHGVGDALRYLVGIAKPQALVLRLYRNDVQPSEEHGAGAFEEAGFPGYAPAPLTAWMVDENSGEAAHPQQAFTRSKPGATEHVYGYFVTRTGGRIAWAERFEQPAPMANAGDKVLVTPRISA